ncbi:MAG TPA: NAD(P)H-hydrate dehydratase [Smithellaceae bacterium]|nr:NAD(P)H-hydrate dehydratase [Smithellaceae bacterium]HRS88454.1 NAD(P)H-hydrate dehydratase [Smithellaceae bacterium]HRV25510.1 NAD(P)H-hydrate dehydratase [Smithellaceae bacterium]
MLLICGTIPQAGASLVMGEVSFDGSRLAVGNTEIPCTQGTAALASAACVVAKHCGSAAPHAVFAGDTGSGKGSRLLYDYLSNNLPQLSPDILLMHYILPVMGLMKQVCAAADKCGKKPVMMADASSMYAAKAAGLAGQFDIFTPDLSEMEFLADPDAIHPAYISRHLFRADIACADDLIAAAFRQKSMAKTVVIKGATDHVIQEGKVKFTLSEPDLPALEAIGGTGDTISGMIGAFVDAGLTHLDAAMKALKANRKAGQLVQAKPATKVREIIAAIPRALNHN